MLKAENWLGLARFIGGVRLGSWKRVLMKKLLVLVDNIFLSIQSVAFQEQVFPGMSSQVILTGSHSVQLRDGKHAVFSSWI